MWSDAGVEGAHRFLRRLWAFAQAHARRRAAATGRVDWRGAAPPVKAARREIHLTLKQANYDYERIQYNTVVSAGMKMLNALEAVPADAAGARGARCARACRSCCACSTRSCRTSAARCGTTSASPASSGRCSTRRGRRSIPAALAQDEIELVLQVNGKLRGKLTRAGDRRPRGDRGGGARESPRSRSTRPARR